MQNFIKVNTRMVHKLRKRFSGSLVIREMHIKTTMRAHSIPFGMSKIKRVAIPSAGQDMKKLEFWNTTSEKQNSTITLETRLTISSHDPAIILLGNHIKQTQAYVHTKALYNNVHSSFICKSQKLESVQMLINRSMNKQNMAYSYNVMLLGKKKKKDWEMQENKWVLK